MAFNTTKGMSEAAFKKLARVFPYERPKLGAPLEEIQRAEGKEDVLDYIRRNMVDNT